MVPPVGQIRDRVISVLHDTDVPPAVIFAFICYVVEHPEREVITASAGNVVRFFTSWKEKRGECGCTYHCTLLASLKCRLFCG